MTNKKAAPFFGAAFLFCRMEVPGIVIECTFSDTTINVHAPDPEIMKQYHECGLLTEFPYWSRIWPSGHALCLYLQNNMELIAQKKIIELGAGLALPSLFASSHATQVLATDYLPDPLDYVKLSAGSNNLVNLTTAILDWRMDPIPHDAEVLLMSDLNYSPGDIPYVLQQIRDWLKDDRIIFLTTPARIVAKDFIIALAPYVRHNMTFTAGDKNIEAFTLAKIENL